MRTTINSTFCADNQFLIRKDMFQEFQGKMKSLIKKAVKLECNNLPGYKIVQENAILEFIKNVKNDKGELVERTFKVPAIQIEVWGESPKLNGWSFVGSIDHLAEGNILNAVHTDTLTQYKDSPSTTCMHCNVKRKRLSTFVVENETKEQKQVGSSCLSDFLGTNVSPDKIASRANIIYAVWNLAREYREFGFDAHGQWLWLSDFLKSVMIVILNDGWKSKKAAKEEYKETGQYVRSTASKASDLQRNWDGEIKYYPVKLTAQDELTITDAIEWATNLTEQEITGNDYLQNIKVLASRSIVEDCFMGYAASIIPAYQRTLASTQSPVVQQTTKPVTVESSFFGCVGTGYTETVALIYKQEKLAIFKTSDGKILKEWLTKKSQEMVKNWNVGREQKIYFMVKDHEIYQGKYNTVISNTMLIAQSSRAA